VRRGPTSSQRLKVIDLPGAIIRRITRNTQQAPRKTKSKGRHYATRTPTAVPPPAEMQAAEAAGEAEATAATEVAGSAPRTPTNIE